MSSPTTDSPDPPIIQLPTGPATIPLVQPTSPHPFTGPDRHCTFVLLAEFDILKGSQLRYQYPRPTKIKENVLAESMLPEGAHLRESDWTVNLLTNEAMKAADQELKASITKAKEKAAKRAASGQPESDTTAAASPESTYFEAVELQTDGYLCMLNLVRTKMDKTVKRGAIVKALAICTRHRFYNIFKPLLMLSLDQYFESTQIENQQAILVNLYHSINNMPLDMIPSLSSLQQRLNRAVRLRTASNPSANDYFMTSVKWDTLPVTFPSQPSSAHQLDRPLSSSSVPSSPMGPAATPTLAAALPMRIPISMEKDEVLEASLTTLVNRFQENIMTIYTALLAEKRIIFLGYQQPASICCECVLSACLLISPPLVGTIHRAFPYANLVNMDFLNVPGYIAGVTNPIFEQRNTWWDLLCNISNGEVTLSPAYAEEIAASNNSIPQQPSSSLSSSREFPSGVTAAASSSSEKDAVTRLSSLDAAFFAELMNGVQLRYGEEWTRCMFRDLTEHFLLLVQDEEQFVFDDLAGSHRQLHLMLNQHRIKAFMKSSQYQTWLKTKSTFEHEESALKDKDQLIRKHVRTLQLLSSGTTSSAVVSKKITTQDIITISQDFITYIHTREQILEFLAMLPESRGGLGPIANGVVHKDEVVRTNTIELLRLCDSQPEGNKLVSSLNYFLLMTYYRFVKAAGKSLPEHFSSEDEMDEHHHRSSHAHHRAYSKVQPLPPPIFTAANTDDQQRTYTDIALPPDLDLLASPTSISGSPMIHDLGPSAPSSRDPNDRVPYTFSIHSPLGTVSGPPIIGKTMSSLLLDDSEEEDDEDEDEDDDDDQFWDKETPRIRAPTFHADADADSSNESTPTERSRVE